MNPRRQDLIALTPDDLAAMANRGLVKRAQREVEGGEFTASWLVEDDGTIVATWSDGAECRLPGAGTLAQATCSCTALGLCRHLLRTVLAWQARPLSVSEGQDATVTGAPSADALDPPSGWDPGAISDETIASVVPKDRRDRASALWNQGVVGELLRGVKPSARFHVPGHSVRFLVRDDLRYTLCSCGEPAPCAHAVLAVFAFRLMPKGQPSGLVCTGDTPAPPDPDLITRCLEAASEIAHHGFSGLASVWRDRMMRLASSLRDARLAWPAQLCEELAADAGAYANHDPLFSPHQSAERLGELLIRLDAIASGTGAIPSAFVRGQATDRDTELGSARMVGLGAMAFEERHGTRLTVFLQDSDTGHVLTLDRAVAEPPESPSPPKPFYQLGRLTVARDSNLFQLSSGQLLMQGGRRAADGRLVLGRARAAVNPQAFRWEDLKAPVLADTFDEIAAHLALLPPASLRPRRAAGDFHVCRVTSVEFAGFDAPSQHVVAELVDPSGQRAHLEHPWSRRGATGAESLLRALLDSHPPVFIAGRVAMSHTGRLVWHATALIFDRAGSRQAVLPWIEPPNESTTPLALPVQPASTPLSWPDEILGVCADTLLTGLQHAPHARWHTLAAAGETRGYSKLPALVRDAADTSRPQAFLTVLKAVRLAADLAAL